MLDVCICTHNPDRQLFKIVLQALSNQTLNRDRYQVWIVDNASDLPIEMTDIEPLTTAGVKCKILVAERLGLMYARDLAISATSNEWLVFVDDDNELSNDYLEIALDIAETNPQLGCFGGKLLLPIEIDYPDWMEQMLPYLAIKDIGDEVISKCANCWGDWEPPGAGFIVRRSLLELSQRRLAALPEKVVLDRQGKSLLSAGDSMIARGAYELGLECAYQPRLKLIHRIKPERLSFAYLRRLLYNHGRSYVLLERVLGNSVPEIVGLQVLGFIWRRTISRVRDFKSLPQCLCMLAWDYGYLAESRHKKSGAIEQR